MLNTNFGANGNVASANLQTHSALSRLQMACRFQNTLFRFAMPMNRKLIVELDLQI